MLPEHLVIIGGGFVAAEFAHVFSSLRHQGDHRSAAARRAARHEDADIAAAFTELVSAQWEVRSTDGDQGVEYRRDTVTA